MDDDKVEYAEIDNLRPTNATVATANTLPPRNKETPWQTKGIICMVQL